MIYFKPFRGTRDLLPQEKHDGYVYFCVDDGSFHMDYIDTDGVLKRKCVTDPTVKDQILAALENLAPVAKSGSFNNLKHKPSALLSVTDDGVLCMNMVYSYEEEYATYDITDDEIGVTISQASDVIAKNNELEVI